MKKSFLASAVIGLSLGFASCSKETTCECQEYEIQEDGSRVEIGDPETRVVDSKDADCSQFNEYDDTLVGNDREVECEEVVLD